MISEFDLTNEFKSYPCNLHIYLSNLHDIHIEFKFYKFKLLRKLLIQRSLYELISFIFIKVLIKYNFSIYIFSISFT